MQLMELIMRPLKTGPIGCPEVSVRNYHSSLRYKPEECSFRQDYVNEI